MSLGTVNIEAKPGNRWELSDSTKNYQRHNNIKINSHN